MTGTASSSSAKRSLAFFLSTTNPLSTHTYTHRLILRGPEAQHQRREILAGAVYRNNTQFKSFKSRVDKSCFSRCVVCVLAQARVCCLWAMRCAGTPLPARSVRPNENDSRPLFEQAPGRSPASPARPLVACGRAAVLQRDPAAGLAWTAALARHVHHKQHAKMSRALDFAYGKTPTFTSVASRHRASTLGNGIGRKAHSKKIRNKGIKL